MIQEREKGREIEIIWESRARECRGSESCRPSVAVNLALIPGVRWLFSLDAPAFNLGQQVLGEWNDLSLEKLIYFDILDF